MFSQLAAARGTCLAPVFVRPWRPNGVNFNETAHLLFHQSSASPEWPEALALPRCLSALGGPNGVNLHLTVASRQMNVQPARSGPRHSPCPGVARDTHSAPKRNLLTAAHPGEQSQCFPASSGQPAAIRDTSQRPEKKSPHRSAPRGAKPVCCPPPAAKRRELQ